MTSIKWNDKYSVRVPEIDYQHQFFFLLIERLERLLAQKCDKIHISNLLDELGKYAVFHFASEENRMLLTGYDDLATHKSGHLKLIQQFNVVKERYDYFDSDAEKIVPFLTEWLLNHTTSEDLKFGDYLRRINNLNSDCATDQDG